MFFSPSHLHFQACSSEAAHLMAPGCLGSPITLQHPGSFSPEGQDPGRAQETEPRRPPSAEPGQDAVLPGRETLRPLQAALPTPVQLLSDVPVRGCRQVASTGTSPLRFPSVLWSESLTFKLEWIVSPHTCTVLLHHKRSSQFNCITECG